MTLPFVRAQSADALIDKPVSKGVLTVKEANDLREESDKNFTTALQTKNGMGDWVQALKFNGDVRACYESLIDNAAFNARTCMRVLPALWCGGAVDGQHGGWFPPSPPASRDGSFGGDPISGNTTFANNASKKFLYLDQVYGKWTPLKVAASGSAASPSARWKTPFVFSDMVFDADYTPEGVATQSGYSVQ